MLRRLLLATVVLAVAGTAIGWFLSAPQKLTAAELPQHDADLANGERVFYAGGCSSCHAAPGAAGDAKLTLAGGLELDTDFGIFRVPNISPDRATGIGGWSTLEFVNAVMRGVSPGGAHLYPAFPYPSYARMRVADVIDLKGFMDTLPAVENRVAVHDLKFPFGIRRGIGLWKRLYLPVDGSTEPVVPLPDDDAIAGRGQYLVEGPGHCGECHTPRNAFGGLDDALWLVGAKNPDGKGSIPNITPGVLKWSQSEIVDALKTGFTPDFDTLGGSMAAVQQNLAHLPDEDLTAMAAYLKAVPPLPDAAPPAARE